MDDLGVTEPLEGMEVLHIESVKTLRFPSTGGEEFQEIVDGAATHSTRFGFLHGGKVFAPGKAGSRNKWNDAASNQ